MLNQGIYIRSIILLIALTCFPSPHVFAQTELADEHQPALSQPLTIKWLYESDLTINLTPATDGERIYLPLASGDTRLLASL